MDKRSPPSNHCHVKSLDTASTLDDFIKREVELESGYAVTTDHGYLGACLDVYKAAQKSKLKPILGIEAYYYDANDPVLSRFDIPKDKYKEYAKYSHLTLHALDQKAYEALVRAISKADATAEVHGSERKFIFTWQDLQELSNYNLTAASSCLAGIVGRSYLHERYDIAEAYYSAFRILFGPNNFYADLYPHVCDRNWVSGVFITLEDGSQLKYYKGKKVKTSVFDDIAVSDLAKAFNKSGKVGKLLGVYNRRKLDEITPQDIVKCEIVEDFIKNECTEGCPDGDLQLGLNKFAMQMAYKYGDKLVFAGDEHYAFPGGKSVQDIKLGNLGDSFRFLPGYHRMDKTELWQYYHHVMKFNELEFERLVNNNFEWASRFDNFKLEYSPSLPASFFPDDQLSYLNHLIKKHGRMDYSNPVMVSRLKQEIDLFYRNGTINLLPYFFLNEDIVAISENGGWGVGAARGSGGGTLLAYLLGIIHINPLKYDLSLDRFLTIDRIKTGKLPDQDLDFENRDYVIAELKKKYGDHVAQISTDNMLRLKSSMKDVARQMNGGEVPKDVMRVSESLPNTPQGIKDKDFIFGYTTDDGKEERGLWDTRADLRDYAARRPQEWDTVLKALNLQRSVGAHASAVIIADKPIKDFIPLVTLDDKLVTQYTASSCELAGAVKCDILGLNTLGDIYGCLRNIRARSGLTFQKEYTIGGIKIPLIYVLPHNGKLYNIYDLPNEPDVFNSICDGKTETVFQLSTEGAIGWLKEFNYWTDDKRKLINDIPGIAAFTALDRPGPLDAIVEENGIKRNMLEEFASRLRKKKPIGEIAFISKELPETGGVITFQEQLTKIYQRLTDCTGIEANNFREDIGKKRMSKVLSLYNPFMEKAIPKIGKEESQKVWDQIYTFGQYGFCSAHAHSYATLAYICAYLKHYFPLEWWCAVLDNAMQSGHKDKIADKFWKYCKNMVVSPDIVNSTDRFYIKGDKIIAPMNLIQGVGEAAHKELTENAPYLNLQDFCRKKANTKLTKGRSALNRGVISRLIISGMLDALFPPNMESINKLEYFEQVNSEVNLVKREKIQKQYQGLNKLQEYQTKKDIFPIYSDFLAPYVTQLKVNVLQENVKSYVLNASDEEMAKLISISGKKFKWWKGNLPVINGQLLDYLDKHYHENPENSLTVGIVGYVTEAKQFSYNMGPRRVSAMGITIDVDGTSYRLVKWPNRKTFKLELPPEDLECAIILAIITKWKADKPFTIDSLLILQNAKGKADDEKSN